MGSITSSIVDDVNRCSVIDLAREPSADEKEQDDDANQNKICQTKKVGRNDVLPLNNWSMDRQRWRVWPLAEPSTHGWILDKGLDVKAVICQSSFLYILTSGGFLCKTSLERTEELQVIANRVKDVCLVSQTLFFSDLDDNQGQSLLLVDEDGSLLVLDLPSLASRNLPKLRDQMRILPRFYNCAAGLSHLALLDASGLVWSSGARIQSGQYTRSSGQEESIPISPIEFFQGVQVLSISCGSDFTIAVVKRLASASSTAEESKSNDSSCPLGLPIQESREKCLNKEDEVVLRKKGSTVIREECEKEPEETQDEKETVERLAMSGLYIKPSEAFKFLSSQLSWMKGGETISGIECRKASVMSLALEASEEADLAMDDNESTMTKATSFVSESMKAVGETVSRLSKSFSTEKSPLDTIPMSQIEPETEKPAQEEKPKEIRPSLSLSHRRSQSVTSFSKVATNDVEKFESKAEKDDIFRHEVWSWGKGRRGQQGRGDMLDRLHPSLLPDLVGLGVIKVVCGDFHAIALTITGGVLGWGENGQKQACPSYNLAVCSLPKWVTLPTGETASDIAACSDSSFILTDVGNVYIFGQHEMEGNNLQKIDLQDDVLSAEKSIGKILSSNKGLLFGSINEESLLPLSNFKALDKLFLHKMKEITKKIIEPLCEMHNEEKNLEEAKKQLLSTSNDLIDLVSQSVLNSWNFCSLEDCQNLSIIKNSDSVVKALEGFTKSVCNFLIIHDSSKTEQDSKLSNVIEDLLVSVCHIHHKSGHESLKLLLMEPTNQIDHYITCLKAIVLAGRSLRVDVAAGKTCDLIEKVLANLRTASKAMDRERKSLKRTMDFWEVAGSKLSILKKPKRRLVLDSKDCTLNLAHATTFGKHWFVLFNDVFVHAGYASHSVHPLQTVWIESHQVTSPTTSSTKEVSAKVDAKELEINLVLPEEVLILVAPDHEKKNEWIVQMQRCIIETLGNSSDNIKSYTPPILRHTSYTFSKLPELKGAEYEGAWLHGKLHGKGKLLWTDGRCYQGQLRQNQKHGMGRLEVPGSNDAMTVYEGQWKFDKFEGKGKIIFANGDLYHGQVKDGKPHGQGTMKQGRFMNQGASLFIGEWSNGYKCGYGVMDDIINGEKYMGMWSNDMKNGQGCVVTFDGLYYEGIFSQNKMAGKGLMIFEDETIYEGHFADTGVFNGVGTLTYPNGDKLEGSFYGNYATGMKFNGTIYKLPYSPSQSPVQPKTDFTGLEKVGRHTVPAEQKWKSIYSFYYDLFSLPEKGSRQSMPNTAMIWEQVAISINQAKNNAKLGNQPSLQRKMSLNSSSLALTHDPLDLLDGLEMIPEYYLDELSPQYLSNVNAYLKKAFGSHFHPLENLLKGLCDSFNTTYGGVKVYPRLLKHAVDEMKALLDGLYYFVRALFPALPKTSDTDTVVDDNGKLEIITNNSILHTHVLPKTHFSLFMLYTLFHKKDDEEYWARILKWNRHPDLALLSFLGVDQNFWKIESAINDLTSARDVHFAKAVETLQQIKTTFTPFEKLEVLLETFKEINVIGEEARGSGFCWSMDDLFPVLQYVVVRARILQLGAEIHMIEDLMDAHLCNGEYGFMFTTFQACYFQILRESISIMC